MVRQLLHAHAGRLRFQPQLEGQPEPAVELAPPSPVHRLVHVMADPHVIDPGSQGAGGIDLARHEAASQQALDGGGDSLVCLVGPVGLEDAMQQLVVHGPLRHGERLQHRRLGWIEARQPSLDRLGDGAREGDLAEPFEVLQQIGAAAGGAALLDERFHGHLDEQRIALCLPHQQIDERGR